jgi:hypothetical protein
VFRPGGLLKRIVVILRAGVRPRDRLEAGPTEQGSGISLNFQVVS